MGIMGALLGRDAKGGAGGGSQKGVGQYVDVAMLDAMAAIMS